MSKQEKELTFGELAKQYSVRECLLYSPAELEARRRRAEKYDLTEVVSLYDRFHKEDGPSQKLYSPKWTYDRLAEICAAVQRVGLEPIIVTEYEGGGDDGYKTSGRAVVKELVFGWDYSGAFGARKFVYLVEPETEW